MDDRADTRIIYGTRRAGKTDLLATMCLLYSMAGETGVFVGPTAQKAADLLRSKLQEFKREHGVSFHWNGNSGVATFEDGGRVQCRGLASNPDVELLRGDRPPFAIIDESGHCNAERLQYVIEEVLQPSLADFWGRGGRGLILAGTPTQDERSYWADLCLRGLMPQASVHKLTIGMNPRFADGKAERYLASVLKNNGWTRETPKFRREYLGEFCPELSSLCVPGWNGELLPQHLAPKDGRVILALDFGRRDKTAYVVIVTIRNHLHAIYSCSHGEQTIPDIVQTINELRARFSPSVIVGDSYGIGSGYILTLRQSHGIPIAEAKYPDRFKAARIDALNGAACSGNLFLYQEAAGLGQQLRSVLWNRERTKQRDGSVDHEFDALIVGADRHRQDYKDSAKSEQEIEQEERAKRMRALQTGR